MYLSILCLLISIGIHACALTKLTGAQSADPNDPLVVAADTVTQKLFDEEQPLINAATASLPVEVQALAQTAYVALEQAVQTAAAHGVGELETAQQQAAKEVVRNLEQVGDILHAAIHVPDVRPTPALGANVTIVPTLSAP